MITIGDTSPVKGLIAIREINLLNKLFGELIIPRAVEKELLKIPFLRDEINEFLALNWVFVKDCENTELLSVLNKTLDPGESEAIVLAKHYSDSLLLIDEKLGRKYAKTLNINILGLIGVLVLAKKKKLVPSVKILLDKLRDETGFWIKEDLYEMILQEVQEN